jgi:hypothetical protein
MIRVALATLLVTGTALADGAPASTPASPSPSFSPSPASASAPATQPASSPASDDDDAPVRLSLPTEEDREAWTRPGFRLQLGVALGELAGLGGAPGGRLLGPLVRVGVRLDESWSLMGGFAYESASATNQLSGLRFAGTLEPTWHVTRSLALAVGFGFGGIVEGRTSRPDPTPLASTLTGSYTFPDASTPLPSCNGVGITGLLRGEWTTVLGPRSSLGVAVTFEGQWTGCVDDSGRVEPDTAAAIVRRQWWPHVGGTVALEIGWR